MDMALHYFPIHFLYSILKKNCVCGSLVASHLCQSFAFSVLLTLTHHTVPSSTDLGQICTRKQGDSHRNQWGSRLKLLPQVHELIFYAYSSDVLFKTDDNVCMLPHGHPNLILPPPASFIIFTILTRLCLE